MSRRRAAVKRDILPDPKFGDKVISRFICNMTKHGKKAAAEKQFYGALSIVEKKALKDDPECKTVVEFFKKAIANAEPMLEVKSRRVGGSNYQVPIEVHPGRRQTLAFRWLIEFARKRPGRSMMERLANELMDAAQKRGGAVKRRDDVHKMAEANRAFAHYRW